MTVASSIGSEARFAKAELCQLFTSYKSWGWFTCRNSSPATSAAMSPATPASTDGLGEQTGRMQFFTHWWKSPAEWQHFWVPSLLRRRGPFLLLQYVVAALTRPSEEGRGCKLGAKNRHHFPNTESEQPHWGHGRAAAVAAAFARVRKSVKLRRGKKVLRQDMTHYSWLHSASTASA